MIEYELNWSLVTDNYKEPKNFKEMFALITPVPPKGNSKEQTILKLNY